MLVTYVKRLPVSCSWLILDKVTSLLSYPAPAASPWDWPPWPLSIQVPGAQTLPSLPLTAGFLLPAPTAAGDLSCRIREPCLTRQEINNTSVTLLASNLVCVVQLRTQDSGVACILLLLPSLRWADLAFGVVDIRSLYFLHWVWIWVSLLMNYLTEAESHNRGGEGPSPGVPGGCWDEAMNTMSEAKAGRCWQGEVDKGWGKFGFRLRLSILRLPFWGRMGA